MKYVEEGKKLIDDINKAVKKEIDTINQVKENASKTFIDSYQVFMEDIAQKKKNMDKKRKDIEIELDEINSKKQSLKNQYAAAVASGNQKQIDSLEQDLISIEGQIGSCKSREQILLEYDLKGNMPLYEKVVNSYKDEVKVLKDNKADVNEISLLLSNTIKSLTKLQSEVDSMRFQSRNDVRMVAVYEKYHGRIDTKNSNLPADETKRRYVMKAILEPNK